MSLSTLELVQIAEGRDLEVKKAGGRDGRGALPQDFWSTYSAMANTDGGVILLGLEEKPGGVFVPVGITDHRKVLKALWDGANDRGQISRNLLSEKLVEVLTINGFCVVRVTVPRALRTQMPVYVGRNPFGGTYQRRFEGDYRAEDETVRRMLAEQVEEARDTRVLEKYSLDDLDQETLKAYRNQVKAAKPNLAWLELNDREFLQKLGGWRNDRETERSGLTVGGLLMFGQLPAIQEEFPHYMLDYQERPEPKADLRWVDRITSDGTWSGNLYDFFRLVIKKLHSDLKMPFQLSGSLLRVDDSPVHQALREALVNTLIHADFTGRVSILVVKRPDFFGFRNPGGMRLTLEDALRGGMSDCRNRILQRLFRMAGFAEQAGTGIPKIYSSWLKKNWIAPRLTDRREPPEQTVLTLPMVSLISEETQSKLETRFGPRFRDLPHTPLVALATVAVEGLVTHARLKSMVADHPRDISSALAQLCREDFLDSAGAARGKYYFFPGEPPEGREGQEMLFDPSASSERSELSSVQMTASSVHLAGSSVQSSVHWDDSSVHWPDLLDLGALVRCRKKAPRSEVESAILTVCQGRYLTLKQLGEILGRSLGSLRIHYLSGMAREGRLVLRYPDAPNHPSQAYTAGTPSDQSVPIR